MIFDNEIITDIRQNNYDLKNKLVPYPHLYTNIIYDTLANGILFSRHKPEHIYLQFMLAYILSSLDIRIAQSYKINNVASIGTITSTFEATKNVFKYFICEDTVANRAQLNSIKSKYPELEEWLICSDKQIIKLLINKERKIVHIYTNLTTPQFEYKLLGMFFKIFTELKDISFLKTAVKLPLQYSTSSELLEQLNTTYKDNHTNIEEHSLKKAFQYIDEQLKTDARNQLQRQQNVLEASINDYNYEITQLERQLYELKYKSSFNFYQENTDTGFKEFITFLQNAKSLVRCHTLKENNLRLDIRHKVIPDSQEIMDISLTKYPRLKQLLNNERYTLYFGAAYNIDFVRSNIHFVQSAVIPYTMPNPHLEQYNCWEQPHMHAQNALKHYDLIEMYMYLQQATATLNYMDPTVIRWLDCTLFDTTLGAFPNYLTVPCIYDNVHHLYITVADFRKELEYEKHTTILGSEG